jgi:hypothetical protein
MTEGVKVIPLEYTILAALVKREWPFEKVFQRGCVREFLADDLVGEIPPQRAVGHALTNLLNVGFIDRVCHTSGQQAYAQADEWADPACVRFLSDHVVRPPEELLPFEPASMVLLKRRVETENCPNVMTEATRRIVRIMRLNRVYITLAKYAWVPAARDLFGLDFETEEEKIERMGETLLAISERDLDRMESFIPPTILQPC